MWARSVRDRSQCGRVCAQSSDVRIGNKTQTAGTRRARTTQWSGTSTARPARPASTPSHRSSRTRGASRSMQRPPISSSTDRLTPRAPGLRHSCGLQGGGRGVGRSGAGRLRNCFYSWAQPKCPNALQPPPPYLQPLHRWVPGRCGSRRTRVGRPAPPSPSPSPPQGIDRPPG